MTITATPAASRAAIMLGPRSVAEAFAIEFVP